MSNNTVSAVENQGHSDGMSVCAVEAALPQGGNGGLGREPGAKDLFQARILVRSARVLRRDAALTKLQPDTGAMLSGAD